MSQQPPWDYSGEYVQPHVQQHVPPQFRGQPYYAPEQQFQPQIAPRKRRWPVIAGWTAAAAVLLAASAGTAFALRHHAAAAAKPLTCKQQYAAWKNGAAKANVAKFKGAAAALKAPGASDDLPAVLKAVRQIGSVAGDMEAQPAMPSCADPKGYWMQYLGELKAVGDDAGSASGLGGLLLLEAPMKHATAIQSKLDAELKHTVGYKAP